MVYFFIDLTVKLSLCLSHGKGGGEKDAAHAPRCPQRPIVVVLVQVERQQIPADDAAQVDEEKRDQPNAQLDVNAKRVETDHIEDQVEPVAVQKATQDQAMILLVTQDACRDEHVPVREFGVLESPVRPVHGKNNDSQRANRPR